MPSYRNTERKYYETEWKRIKPDLKPGIIGWKTMSPDPEFLMFVRFMKQKRISGRVLDIGSGSGRHSLILAQKGFDVHGVDFSSNAIKLAKKIARSLEYSKIRQQLHYRAGSILSLTFPGNFFDIINDDGCFHHISPNDRHIYLATIKKTLKTGGYLRLKVFSTNDERFNGAKNQWMKLNNEDWSYFFTAGELKSLFGKDFKIVKLFEETYPFNKKRKFLHLIAYKK